MTVFSMFDFTGISLIQAAGPIIEPLSDAILFGVAIVIAKYLFTKTLALMGIDTPEELPKGGNRMSKKDGGE